MGSVRKFFRKASFAAPATLVLGLIFAIPLVGIVMMSLQKTNDGGDFSFATYIKIATTSLFFRVAYTTVEISVGATFCALLIAYPISYFLATQPPRRRALFMILVLVPFWTSSLVKVFSFMVLLGYSGIINQLLDVFGIPPVKLLFNRIGVLAGMSHYLVPFFVFPIVASLQSQPPELARAAATMGAGKLRIFLRVTLPLSLPGVIAGALLVFTISLSFYVIPALLGGREDMMVANLIDFYAREVLDWPMASTVAVLLIGVAVAVSIALSKVRGGASMLEGSSD